MTGDVSASLNMTRDVSHSFEMIAGEPPALPEGFTNSSRSL